ncbi:Nucleosomal histone H3-Lys79 methylase [Tulasnella sp. 403]|nr:Nucleosomal histone H3-Lys79 methylase [Tulasnella sp. 403]
MQTTSPLATLSFCPPPPPPNSILGATKMLATLNGNKLAPPPTSHPSLVGALPLTAAHFPPAPAASILPPISIPAIPTKRKRAVPADGQPRKRKSAAKAVPSPPTPLPALSRSRSPTATIRPPDDSDSEAEIDYSIFSTRRSTPASVKEGSFPFGAREEYTLHREIRTPTRRQQLRCGTEGDGRVKCITSEEVVRPIAERYYKPYFRNLDDPNDTSFNVQSYPTVEVEYPNHGASEHFILLIPNDKDHYNPILELMNSIHTIVGYYFLPHEQTAFGTLPSRIASKPPSPASPTTETAPSLASGSSPLPPQATDHLRNMEKAYNTHNGPLFIASINEINALLRVRKHRMMQNVQYGWDGVPPGVWKTVVEECYQRCVGPSVKDLSKYQPFSDTVYGELNSGFVSDIAFRTNLRANSTFIDLGCGVGNCLIQAALQVGCTANGIEINPPPAALGKLQVEQFQKRLRLWGLNAGPVTFRQGDLTEDLAVREWIAKADVVLVNNYAFSASLNEKLSLMFLDLPQGAQVISLKPFRPSDFRLTERTVSSPQAIFRVEEVSFKRGSVSWTGEGGRYWLHTVDREPLRRFIEKSEKQRQLQMSAPRRKRNSGREGSDASYC